MAEDIEHRRAGRDRPAPQSAYPRGALGEWTAKVLVALVIVALALFLWRVLPMLVLLFVGVLLALALRTIALPISRVTRIPERVSVLVTLVVVLAALGWGLYAFGASIGQEVGDLLDQVTATATKLEEMIQGTRVGQYFSEGSNMVEQGLSTVVSRAGRVAQGTFGVVADLVLVIFTAAYLAIDPGLYRRGFIRLLPPARRGEVDRALVAVGEDLRKWLIGQAGAMVAVGVLTGVGLWLAGVPRPAALGLIAGLTEFIPFVGPILGAIPGILLAFSGGTDLALWALLVYVIVQQVEGNVIMPIAQNWAVHLPPAVGLLAVVAFALLFGLPGVLIGTPLAVALMRLIDMLYVKGTLERRRGT